MNRLFDHKKIPTQEVFCEFIKFHGFNLDPIALYKEFESKGWTNEKGKVTKSWTALVCARNSVVCQRERRKELAKLGIVKKKHEKKQKLELRVVKAKTKDVKIHYGEYLKDERWYAFRRFAFSVKGHKCERCGSLEQLQVHHIKYKDGLLPWEYSTNEVMVLCRDCHARIHGIKSIISKS